MRLIDKQERIEEFMGTRRLAPIDGYWNYGLKEAKRKARGKRKILTDWRNHAKTTNRKNRQCALENFIIDQLDFLPVLAGYLGIPGNLHTTVFNYEDHSLPVDFTDHKGLIPDNAHNISCFIAQEHPEMLQDLFNDSLTVLIRCYERMVYTMASRKNQSGFWLESEVKKALYRAYDQTPGMRLQNRLLEQQTIDEATRFWNRRQRYWQSMKPVQTPLLKAEGRKPDFCFMPDLPMAIESNMFQVAGSKQEVNSYKYVSNLKAYTDAGWNFALVTDGNGWKNHAKLLDKIMDHFPVYNLAMIESRFADDFPARSMI